MKTVMMTVVAMLFFAGAKAQVYVQGGVNLANITTTDAGETQDNHLLTTFNAGVMSRFGISAIFDFETGLLLEGRGAKAETYFTSSEDDNYVKARFNPLYLKLPLHAVVKFPVSTTGSQNIFVYAGPYGAAGIGGKSKVTTKILGVESTSTSDINFNDDDPTTDEQEGARYDRIKRFDFGIDAGAGIDFGKVLLKVNYGLGLTKINSTNTDNDANDKNKYRTVSISLGIPLGNW